MADFGVNRQFPNRTLKLRNPLNNFDLTFTNPVITSAYNAKFIEPYNYLVFKDEDDGNYKAKHHNWALESSNSTAETVLQYAIDNADDGGTIGIRHEVNDWIILTDQISLIDKNVHLTGVHDNYVNLAANGANTWGGTVIKKNYATAEPLIDITNTAFMVNSLSNMRIIGNSTAGDTGVKLYFGRKNIFTNVSITGFNTGVDASGWVDADIHSLRVADNLTYGLKTNFAGAGKLNTVRFYGGSISSNPTNLYVDTSGMNDVQFFGTQFEGINTGHVKSVQIETGANDIKFYGCSFEKNGETTPVIIYDGGNNNSYIGCRFDSDVSYTPINFRSTSKNNSVINCFFQTNTGATTSTILIDASAVSNNFIGNTKSTNTVGTVTLTDNGTLTTKLGNSQMGSTWNDRVPSGIELGANGLRLTEISSTVAGVRDTTNANYRNLSVGRLGCTSLSWTNQVDTATMTASLFTPLVPVKFEDYRDLKVITIPADPAAGYLREYPKAADANTDSLYVKAKLQGAVVEFNFFP